MNSSILPFPKNIAKKKHQLIHQVVDLVDWEKSMSIFEKVLETKMPVVAALKNDERKKMRPFGAL